MRNDSDISPFCNFDHNHQIFHHTYSKLFDYCKNLNLNLLEVLFLYLKLKIYWAWSFHISQNLVTQSKPLSEKVFIFWFIFILYTYLIEIENPPQVSLLILVVRNFPGSLWQLSFQIVSTFTKITNRCCIDFYWLQYFYMFSSPGITLDSGCDLQKLLLKNPLFSALKIWRPFQKQKSPSIFRCNLF